MEFLNAIGIQEVGPAASVPAPAHNVAGSVQLTSQSSEITAEALEQALRREREEVGFFAWHEAGHAVVAELLGIPICYIRLSYDRYHVRYRSKTITMTCHAKTACWRSHHRRKLERYICKTLAGGEVTNRQFGTRDGSELDMERAIDMAKCGLHCRSEAVDAYVAYQQATLRNLLDEPGVWPAIETVANHLVDLYDVQGEEVQLWRTDLMKIIQPAMGGNYASYR